MFNIIWVDNMSIMLTFVLLYIIIITKLGVITPTYVYTYVSIYQILCSGRFRWEQYALIKKEMSVHCSHFTSLVGRWSPHICSFLSFRDTHHVLLLCIITGEYPEKRHFLKMAVWKGQPYASAKETHASVSFLRGLCWLLIFFVV